MKRIAVVGGGFAGLSAARLLGRVRRPGFEVVLFDRRAAQQNLPLIPDLAGRAYNPALFQYNLAQAARSCRFTFRQQEVVGIDIKEGRLHTTVDSCPFDYLVVAAGSRTHLRHMASDRDRLMVLDSAADAELIRTRLETTGPQCVIVAGGGYTGVELVSQLRCAQKRSGRACRTILLNRRDRTCRNLPPWMSRYVEKNLGRLGVEIRHHTTLQSVEDGAATLSSGETLEGALVVWTAGVRPPDVVRTIGAPVREDGRLVVDTTLGIGERGYAAGDAAGMLDCGKPVRMSVQFAVMSGRHAARNILGHMTGRPPRHMHHVDLGYVVPMANFRACGTAMGFPLVGCLPMLLHYAMSLYRTFGRQNRIMLLAAMLRG